MRFPKPTLSSRNGFLALTLMFTIPWVVFTLLCYMFPVFLSSPKLAKKILPLIYLAIGILEAGLLVYVIASLTKIIWNYRKLRHVSPEMPQVQLRDIVLPSVSFLIGSIIFYVVWNYLAPSRFAWDGDVNIDAPPLATVIHDWLHLDGYRWGIFTFIGMVSGLVFYLSFGRLLARLEQIPFRSMCGKGITCQWWLVSITYLLSLLLAFAMSHAARKAFVELEHYHGRELSFDALGESILQNYNTNSEFWHKANDIWMPLLDQKLGKNRSEEDSNNGAYQVNLPYFCKRHCHAKMSPDIMELINRELASNSVINGLEKLFASEIPMPTLEDSRQYRIEEICHDLFYCELWKLRAAIEEKNIESALIRCEMLEKLLSLFTSINKTCRFGTPHDYEIDYIQMLEILISSGMGDEAWLQGLAQKLDGREEEYRQILAGQAYLFAVGLKDYFKDLDEGYGFETPKPLKLSSCRFLFPQAWWMMANDKRMTAVAAKTKDFSNWPEEHGFLFYVTLQSDYFYGIHFWHRQFLARSRCFRCLVAAELVRCSTGQYPERLDDIPEDPYTGKELLYRKGKFKQTEFVLKIINKEKEYDFPKNSTLDYIGDNAIEVRKTTIDVTGIQAWSLGQNQQDDEGLDDRNRNCDDIRSLIRASPFVR